MADLKIIWHYKYFTSNSYCNPQTILKFEFCENLVVQETCHVPATQLKELHLRYLPKLKHIWNKDPQQIYSFAMGCESMESPIPGAEEGFPEIQRVLIDDHGVKEIVLWNQNSSEVYPGPSGDYFGIEEDIRVKILELLRNSSAEATRDLHLTPSILGREVRG
jgi:hypothetical protein